MTRDRFTSAVVLLLAFAAGACTNATTSSQPENTGYGSTVSTQGTSDYFPEPGAPLVAPTENPGDPNSTVFKQQKSGYFPSPDAPLIEPPPSVR